MPGKTGKRAKPPSPCVDCGEVIAGRDFYRERDGDRCEDCFVKRMAKKYPDSPLFRSIDQK